MKKLDRTLITPSSLSVIFTVAAVAQSDTRQLQPLLAAPIHSSEITEFQLRQYVMKRVTHVRVPEDGRKWDSRSAAHSYASSRHVIFHGWPKEWVSARTTI